MDFESKDIRNVAIAGHSQTGKTTLLEQLLRAGGKLDKAAAVESGKTVSGCSPEETLRHISIYSYLAHLERGSRLINIWDTPGASDFTGEVISAFRSSEAALLLVDSRSGAQVETVKLWRDLDRRSKPRMVFLNRADDARGNVSATVQDLHDKFNVEICQVTIPMGTGPAYKGVIDVLRGKAYLKGPDGDGTAEAIPPEYEEAYRSARGILMGSAAEGDDDLLVKFIDEGELTDEEILSGLKAAFAANKVVPCFSGDPLHGSGLVPLLDFIADVCPSPLDGLERAVTPDGTEGAVKFQPDGQFGALVVKTAGDQFSGKLSYLKIISGSLSADSSVTNLSGAKAEKIGKLYRTQGKKLEEIKKASAGDICVVAKLGAATGDTLASDAAALPYKPLRRPEPVYSLAISCAEKKNEMKVTENKATKRSTTNEATDPTMPPTLPKSTSS
jgi:elongation factor G